MRVARLLLCYVLLEDYSTNLGGAAITGDAARQDASATNPTLPDLPSFTKPIGNVTAAIGKEAVLPCTIRNLGNYKVGWLRMEDQTILSMGQRTVTHSPRYLVTLENAKAKNQSQSKDEEEATSRLHIRQLREADRGCYMCQLNTKPMLSQLGCVDVLVSPDILSSGTSEGEVSVSEGENATLSCNASGRPPPRVLWRREKSGSILMRGLHDPLIPVDSWSGEKLELTRVDRRQMGAYLCIARNEVPPAVSKRVYLRVNFSPSAKVPNELLGSPLDTDVSLICLVEAYPKTINLWTRREQVIMSGGRYEINERGHPDEEWKTTIELKIRRLEKTDLGEYTCSASSSMGRAEATLRVYGKSTYTIDERVIFRRPSPLAAPLLRRLDIPFRFRLHTIPDTSISASVRYLARVTPRPSNDRITNFVRATKIRLRREPRLPALMPRDRSRVLFSTAVEGENKKEKKKPSLGGASIESGQPGATIRDYESRNGQLRDGRFDEP
ncbi:lachesin isoform X1 [Ptiloglossa arizonensis]|uniref:lachesin isoform X1 n=1 Tax=Ptiloglossa arizonensis TaxID=3350558 RepID=UPI003F9FF3C9